MAGSVPPPPIPAGCSMSTRIMWRRTPVSWHELLPVIRDGSKKSQRLWHISVPNRREMSYEDWAGKVIGKFSDAPRQPSLLDPSVTVTEIFGAPYGFYFFWDQKKGKCVYVGEGNLKTRFVTYSNASSADFAKVLSYDRIRDPSNPRFSDILIYVGYAIDPEKELIAACNPIVNKSKVGSSDRLTLKQWDLVAAENGRSSGVPSSAYTDLLYKDRTGPISSYILGPPRDSLQAMPRLEGISPSVGTFEEIERLHMTLDWKPSMFTWADVTGRNLNRVSNELVGKGGYYVLHDRERDRFVYVGRTDDFPERFGTYGQKSYVGRKKIERGYFVPYQASEGDVDVYLAHAEDLEGRLIEFLEPALNSAKT